MKCRKTTTLPLRTVVGFALPGLGYGAIDLIFMTFTLKFATDTLLIPPALMGGVFAAGRLWDAVSDPIVGYLSDITVSTGLGRRRMWMLSAAVPFGFFFSATFSPPASLISVTALASWMAAGIFCYYSAHTAFTVPHLALGAELSETVSYADRTRLFGARAFCSNGIGGLAGVGCLALLFHAQSSDPDSMRATTARVCGALGLFTALLITLAVALLPEVAGRSGLSRRHHPFSLAAVILSTRHARVFTSVATLHEGSRAAFAVLGPYVIQYGLELSPMWVAPLMAAYLLGTLVGIPFWVSLAAAHGKVLVFRRSIWVYALLNLLFVPGVHPRFNAWRTPVGTRSLSKPIEASSALVLSSTRVVCVPCVSQSP